LDVLLIIDMQESLLLGEEKYDLAMVIERINRLAGRVRESGGQVIFIQHDGTAEDHFAPFTPGWAILGTVHQDPRDRSVRKTRNDAFFATSLHSELMSLCAQRVLVCGWATDFCVDATVRSAATLGFEVVVASDCHTLSPRPHLSAQAIIEHHHWIWCNLISPHPVRLVPEAEILTRG
jgi:nicotinamidase-related amidase